MIKTETTIQKELEKYMNEQEKNRQKYEKEQEKKLKKYIKEMDENIEKYIREKNKFSFNYENISEKTKNDLKEQIKNSKDTLKKAVLEDLNNNYENKKNPKTVVTPKSVDIEDIKPESKKPELPENLEMPEIEFNL